MTLITMALIAGTALSAHAKPAKPQATTTAVIYACFEASATKSFYKLAAQDDTAAKREMESFMADARHADLRLCRSFATRAVVTAVLPDTGTGYTCTTDKKGMPNDKMCYWAPTSDLALRSD